jgi:hypothetical protein
MNRCRKRWQSKEGKKEKEETGARKVQEDLCRKGKKKDKE